MKKETDSKMVMVHNDQLKSLITIASEALNCLNEYAGDDSETYQHLKKQFEKWNRYDYK